MEHNRGLKIMLYDLDIQRLREQLQKSAREQDLVDGADEATAGTIYEYTRDDAIDAINDFGADPNAAVNDHRVDQIRRQRRNTAR